MASDPGFSDVLGGEETIGELPYPQEYDYLWTDERNSREEGNGILDPSLWFQGVADRQGIAAVIETNIFAVALVAGFVFTGLLLANSLLNPPPRPKLENYDMCGITTGGQDECWWDCIIISAQQVYGQAVTNPECLRDCFLNTTISEDDCFALLIEDVTSKGTCKTGDNPAEVLNIWGFSELGNNCDLVERPAPDYGGDSTFMNIISGTCSSETEESLKATSCIKFLEKQPEIVKNTIELLIQYSCSKALYDFITSSQSQLGERSSHRIEQARLAPGAEVDITSDIKTELNYENTRHRYPWICSLRTRGVNSEHLCAVNLLEVPPNPTVIVGAAHCTYLCKDMDNNGVSLPSCCCVTSNKGQESCSADTVKCGRDPKAVEMDGSDAEIICGEWQTDSTSQNVSGEKYNVVLPIVEIIQSPAFDAEGQGPGGGSDIAVFKVNDTDFQDPRKHKIYPACLPPKDRSPPTEGVHSGWSKPPPLHFLRRFAEGYLPFYDDFFKQWHYKMKIQESCADPTKTQIFGLPVKHPSKTYYPPATVHCGASNENEGNSKFLIQNLSTHLNLIQKHLNLSKIIQHHHIFVPDFLSLGTL